MIVNGISDEQAHNAANQAQREIAQMQHEEVQRFFETKTDIHAGKHRERTPVLTVPANHDYEADARERMIAATLYNKNSGLSAEPFLAQNEQVREIELVQRHAETCVEYFYAENPDLMAAHLLAEYSLKLQKIIRRAEASYNNYFRSKVPWNDESDDCYGTTYDPCEEFGWRPLPPWIPGFEIAPVAISTSRPGKRWPIRGKQTLDSVLTIIERDVWCDIGLDDDPWAECVSRMIDGCTSNRPITFPFAHGDLVIFLKICAECWQAFIKREQIKTKKCRIVEPWNEGYGELPY